jgi:hypothetical protein
MLVVETSEAIEFSVQDSSKKGSCFGGLGVACWVVV